MERATSIPIKMELLTTTNAKKASKSWCFLSQDPFSWIFHVTLWEKPSIWESYDSYVYIYINSWYIVDLWWISRMRKDGSFNYLNQVEWTHKHQSQATTYSHNQSSEGPLHISISMSITIYQYLETTAWPRSKKFHQAAQATARRIPSVSPAGSNMESNSQVFDTGVWKKCIQSLYRTHVCIHTHIYMIYMFLYQIWTGFCGSKKHISNDQGKSPWSLEWETSCGGIDLKSPKRFKTLQGFLDAPWSYCDWLWLLQFFVALFFSHQNPYDQAHLFIFQVSGLLRHDFSAFFHLNLPRLLWISKALCFLSKSSPQRADSRG